MRSVKLQRNPTRGTELDGQPASVSEVDNKFSIETIYSYRYHYIPFVILGVFVIMIIVCLENSPKGPDGGNIYKEKKYFHISNLGNWQEGVGFFSFFMTSMAILLLVLFKEVNRHRELDVCEDGEGAVFRECHHRKYCDYHTYLNWLPEIHNLSSIVFMVGIVVTGCFQQSFNKPWHTSGFMTIMGGFTSVVVCDLLHYYRRRICFKETEGTISFRGKAAVASRLVVSLIILGAGVSFLISNQLAKAAWSDGEDAALQNLSLIECPEWNVDVMMNDSVAFPNYYPCKSRTLWAPEDPGWEFFRYSAILEFLLFSSLVLYSFTYLCELPAKPLMPKKKNELCPKYQLLTTVPEEV